MRQVLRDDFQNAFFLREGYAVVDFIGDSDVDRLLRLFDELGQSSKLELSFTINSSDFEYRRHMHDSLMEVLAPAADRILHDYRPFGPNFVTKAPRGDRLAVHLDNSVMDESKYVPALIWCALDEMTEEIGCLSVVPQSHRWTQIERAFGDQLNRSPFAGVINRIENELAVPKPIHRGQAIVYHARTMHGSLPNRTDRLRMVTLMGNRPKEAPLLFRHRVSDTQIERFESSEAMYWNDYFVHQRPQKCRSLGVFDVPPPPPLSPQEFQAVIDRCQADPQYGLFG